jgi:hypothetical protein
MKNILNIALVVLWAWAFLVFVLNVKSLDFNQSQEGYIQSEEHDFIEEGISDEYEKENLKTLTITNFIDASKIGDLKLRSFARRNAVFSKDKVLYFEWKGNPNDSISIETIAKGEKYKIVLHKSQEDDSKKYIHKKVYVVPKNSGFELEIK